MMKKLIGLLIFLIPLGALAAYATATFTLNSTDLGAPNHLSAGLAYSNKVLFGDVSGYLYVYSGGSTSQVFNSGVSAGISSLFKDSQGTVLISWKGGIWRTTNDGSTVTQVFSFPKADGSATSITEDSNHYLYAGQYATDSGCGCANLYQSTNDGQTWSEITPSSWSSLRHVHWVYWDQYRSLLFVVVGDPGGTGNSVYYSSQPISSTSFSAAPHLTQSLAITSDANYIYGGQDGMSTACLYRTTSVTGYPQYLYCDSTATDIWWLTTMDANGFLWAAHDVEGSTAYQLLYSINQGATWTVAITKTGDYVLKVGTFSAYYTGGTDGFLYGGSTNYTGAQFQLVPGPVVYKGGQGAMGLEGGGGIK
jgi:hypothetical protein